MTPKTSKNKPVLQSRLTPCVACVVFLRQQGDALEQRHHPEGLGGLHQEAAEGAAEGQGGGYASEKAGAHEPQPPATHPGQRLSLCGVFKCHDIPTVRGQ